MKIPLKFTGFVIVIMLTDNYKLIHFCVTFSCLLT
jgi:hypothetical protein